MYFEFLKRLMAAKVEELETLIDEFANSEEITNEEYCELYRLAYERYIAG